jgi:hypothetical protein
LSPFPSAYFTDGPRAIAGLSLEITGATGVVGGTPLAGDYAAYEIMGDGLVVVFGDRSDHDAFIQTDGSDVNSQLFLNLLDLAPGYEGMDSPVPLFNKWSAILMILLLAGAAIYTGRRRAA